jgi:hypothetical protein
LSDERRPVLLLSWLFAAENEARAGALAEVDKPEKSVVCA